MVFGAYSLKRGEFRHFTVTVRLVKFSRVGVRVMVRFSFSDRMELGLPDVE